MSILATNAANAYAQVADLAKAAASGAPSGADAPGEVNFGAMLRGMMSDAVTIGRDAEAKSIGALTGQVELVDVVTAITAAESTLETVVAVRDRVITAYQDISRMPI